MAKKKNKKNNQNSTPRRKRMNRQGRLQHVRATNWIDKYNGKNLVKGYSKWFGVDRLCAVSELEMLGQKISEKYKERLTDPFKDFPKDISDDDLPF